VVFQCPVRGLGLEPQATRRRSPQRRHVGPGPDPGLVDEDQTLRLDAVLILAPLRPPARDVGAIAFAGYAGANNSEPAFPRLPLADIRRTRQNRRNWPRNGHRPSHTEPDAIYRGNTVDGAAQ
jgi:hypothetical protein